MPQPDIRPVPLAKSGLEIAHFPIDELPSPFNAMNAVQVLFDKEGLLAINNLKQLCIVCAREFAPDGSARTAGESAFDRILEVVSFLDSLLCQQSGIAAEPENLRRSLDWIGSLACEGNARYYEALMRRAIRAHPASSATHLNLNPTQRRRNSRV
jgi:hypothetical protein